MKRHFEDKVVLVTGAAVSDVNLVGGQLLAFANLVEKHRPASVPI
jgi:hypothetical protein